MTMTSVNRLAVMAIILFFLAAACSPTRPLPQPRRVADPGEVQGAVRTSQWDIATVGYEYPGQGLNYSEAGLDPVYLVFRNHSGERPVIDPEEVRGVAPDGDYLAYSRSEAERLVFASETFSVTASNAVRTGGLGAVLGAGLGALIGSVGGGDNIWKGAVIGGAIGGAGGAVATLPEAESRLRRVIREELEEYAWKDNPVPDDYTKVGYLYFPDRDIRKVKLVVRWEGRSETYTVPVAQPPVR